MRAFVDKHGLGVRAVGVTVDDAKQAYEASVANGGRGVLPPTDLGGGVVITEVSLYGDVVLQYVSGVDDDAKKTFLPKYRRPASGASTAGSPLTYGLRRLLDPRRGNVHDLIETVDYITAFTGMHQFAEFTAEDVGTVDSGELDGARQQQRVRAFTRERAHVRDEAQEPDPDVPGAERRTGAAAPGAEDGRRVRDGARDARARRRARRVRVSGAGVGGVLPGLEGARVGKTR